MAKARVVSEQFAVRKDANNDQMVHIILVPTATAGICGKNVSRSTVVQPGKYLLCSSCSRLRLNRE